MKISTIIKVLKSDSENSELRDATRVRMFLPYDGYVETGKDWVSFTTDQDASYFAVTINPVALQTLTYCEGDWSLVECPDATSFNREVQDVINFYGVPKSCSTYHPDGTVTHEYEDTSKFFATEKVSTNA